MSFKIALIGAGSLTFTRKLVRDFLVVPEFHNMEIAFMDISAENLKMVHQLCQRDIYANGSQAKITATTDRRRALDGAKYVFTLARIGGLEAFRNDVEIPLKYGVDQCVGDTLGPGGIMYGQRGIPVLLDICRDIKKYGASDAVLFNYCNPMAMITWACNQYGGIKTIGLCHGVQHGHALIADALGIDKEELDIICAGINHQTWYIQIRHKGREIKSDELLKALERHPQYSKAEKVRIDMLRRFGYFSTESNGHLSEYLPWYRKDRSKLHKWIDQSKWSHGVTAGYLNHVVKRRNDFRVYFRDQMKERPFEFDASKRSSEHASYILEALETGRIYRGHFNVVNHGSISNLPDDAIIEAPGYVDHNGINTPKVGNLPMGCAAICNASISVQRLAVEAAVKGDGLLLRQAMMMDPLTGAVCDTPAIWEMTDKMVKANVRWLPQHRMSNKRMTSMRKVNLVTKTRGSRRYQLADG